MAKLAKDKRGLQTKVLDLEKKNASDCTLILNQCKELEQLSDASKLAKVQVKKLQSQLKTAHSLFKKTLTVKKDYEKIILNLHQNSSTNWLTQQIINEVTTNKDKGSVTATKQHIGQLKVKDSNFTSLATNFTTPSKILRSKSLILTTPRKTVGSVSPTKQGRGLSTAKTRQEK